MMLYISPQSLARPELQQCLEGLISRQVLSVVGIDEMQHVVMDGRFFRREFQLTKKLLLDPLVPPVVNDCCDPFPYPNPPPNPDQPHHAIPLLTLLLQVNSPVVIICIRIFLFKGLKYFRGEVTRLFHPRSTLRPVSRERLKLI